MWMKWIALDRPYIEALTYLYLNTWFLDSHFRSAKLLWKLGFRVGLSGYQVKRGISQNIITKQDQQTLSCVLLPTGVGQGIIWNSLSSPEVKYLEIKFQSLPLVPEGILSHLRSSSLGARTQYSLAGVPVSVTSCGLTKPCESGPSVSAVRLPRLSCPLSPGLAQLPFLPW